MKVLGLSFGRKNGNCDILCKEALLGAKAAYPDAEFEFINTTRLKIDRCIGCGACSMGLERGKEDNDCVVKDDLQIVENAIREADAVILAAPVYTLQPVGQFKNLVDRFSCRHDVSALSWIAEKRETGEMPGDAADLRAKIATRMKKRYVSFISVGGAITDDWTSMGTASLHLFAFSAMMNVVANYNANKMGTVGNPYVSDELIEHMHELGAATALAMDKEPEDVEFYAPQGNGICPNCHQRLLMLNLDFTTEVSCPICGIQGQLTIEDGKIKVDFPEAQLKRARGTFAGLREHTAEIQGFGAICGPKIMAKKDYIDKQMNDRIKNFDELINA